MTTWAVVVAAGRGDRFGGPKQYLELGGKRLVDWALAGARRHADGVVLVVSPEREHEPEPQADVVVAGGETRSDSVRCGLAAVPPDAAVVLVHDAARPLAPDDVWVRVAAAVAEGADAVVPAVPVHDTLKRVDGSRVLETVDRRGLVAVQTPQGFRTEILRQAHAGAPDATDDAALVESLGGKVVTVEGDPRNLKVTTPADLALVERLL